MIDTVSPESVGLSSERLRRVSGWLGDQITAERLAGASVLVGRRGEVAFFEARGLADQASGRSFDHDTIVRIYSMTKPVTTVAAMMLYEAGAFQLDDPVSKYLPEFAEARVWAGGDAPITRTVPVDNPMTIQHLMTHTSGLTYGFMQTNVVDAAYRTAKMDFPGGPGTLAEQVEVLAGIPLLCQPGSRWNYSVSIDVLGRLVEVWSGQSLAEFFRDQLFEPLDMADAGFHVAREKHGRFAACYAPLSGGDLSGIGKLPTSGEAARRGGLKLQDAAEGSRFLEPATLYAGGGGLTASMRDYARFCQMLMNGGALDGARILSPKTIAYMRMNHLPENRDMAGMGQPVWSETSYDGIGFGLGWAVVIDPVKARFVTSAGEHHWGGAASTFFWMDPEEELYVILLTQLMPSSTYPIRRELRQRVYQAIVD
ncbi:MAG TPA: serine hydrolase domain-containing protein [Pseudomonadales bacterium]